MTSADCTECETYDELVKKVAEDYRSREQKRFITRRNGDKAPIPLWHDDYFLKTEDTCQLSEINLWTYWQGAGVRNPKAMIVGQDWGCIEGHRKTVENIKRIERAIKAGKEPLCLYQDGREENESRDFDTDRNLAEAFKIKEINRYIDDVRYDDLFFTNLCLGYRQGGNSTDFFSASWITNDANKYFKELVRLINPKIIVALGQDTAKKAYRALTGNTLKQLNHFNDFLDNQTKEGTPLPGGRIFFAMPHMGWRGVSNRSRNGKSYKDDWKILEEHLR